MTNHTLFPEEPSFQIRCLRRHAYRLIVIGYAALVGRTSVEPNTNFNGDLQYIRDLLKIYFPKHNRKEKLTLLRHGKDKARVIITKPNNSHAIETLAQQIESRIAAHSKIAGVEIEKIINTAIKNRSN